MISTNETEIETMAATTTNRRQELVSIQILNDDILDRIFQYLYFDDRIRLRSTCFRWKYLLDSQLEKVKALRLGRFIQGGYCVTSGLSFPHTCNHQAQSSRAKHGSHRRHTGAMFSGRFLEFPADLETQCFSVNRYDYLHRALKYCQSSITMLSLGQINITYRLLMVIAHNLPNLEHLEIIGCASRLDLQAGNHRKPAGAIKSRQLPTAADQEATRSRSGSSCSSSSHDDQQNHQPAPTRFAVREQQQQRIPSLETFNSSSVEHQDVYKMLLYNQHGNEQQNIRERLVRSNLLRNCDLVRESKRHTYWPQLRHLLIKDCNLLNEFSLCLIVAITSKTLTHLVVESNQYLTGEFLNYCGPNLIQLRLNHCPMIRAKFLDDLVKLKQLLACDQKATFDYKHTNPAPAQHISGAGIRT